MKLKSKLFGIIAAAALSLTMVAGASANTEVDGKLTLDGGACSVSVISGSFDFGTLEWTGSRWEFSTSISNRINIDVDPGWTPRGETGSCAVTVSTTGLTNGTHTFTQPYFWSGAQTGIRLWPAGVLPITHEMNGGSDRNFISIRLYHPVPNSFSPGEYTGTFTLTVDDGQ